MPNEIDSSHGYGIRLKLQELLGKLAEKLGRGGRMALNYICLMIFMLIISLRWVCFLLS